MKWTYSLKTTCSCCETEQGIRTNVFTGPVPDFGSCINDWRSSFPMERKQGGKYGLYHAPVSEMAYGVSED